MNDKVYRGVRVPWRYLIASHGEAALRDWAQRLQFFRFCRAVPGGHAADGDSLRLALKDEDLPRRFAEHFPDAASTIPLHVSYGDDVLWLGLAGAEGDAYTVTAKDVENALLVEDKIEPLAAYVIDPPMDSPYCLAPKFWPEFWRED